MFVAKLVRLTLQVYFNMMSSICYINLFTCGRSVTLQIWQSFLLRQSIAILTLWSLSQLGLLELSCSCCWNVGRYEFSQTSFWTVSFTRSLPNTSIHRSRTLEGGVKEPIIQIPRNFSVPCTVQFIGLFGFVWLLYKFVTSAILASSSSVKKKICFQNFWEVQTFKIFSGNFIYSLNLKAVFKHYVPPTTVSFLENAFLHFPDALSAL